MIKKTLRKDGYFHVSFYTEAMAEVESVHLVGSFNDWDTNVHPMRRLKNGRYMASCVFDPGARHEFRYLVNGENWINDAQADQYAPNPHGSDNCVVTT
ncbi:MAG: glycoside hydrolase [Chloroflexi bacterium]|nr:glycoside hydrolase [Chloroflexota bacterium]